MDLSASCPPTSHHQSQRAAFRVGSQSESVTAPSAEVSMRQKPEGERDQWVEIQSRSHLPRGRAAAGGPQLCYPSLFEGQTPSVALSLWLLVTLTNTLDLQLRKGQLLGSRCRDFSFQACRASSHMGTCGGPKWLSSAWCEGRGTEAGSHSLVGHPGSCRCTTSCLQNRVMPGTQPRTHGPGLHICAGHPLWRPCQWHPCVTTLCPPAD